MSQQLPLSAILDCENDHNGGFCICSILSKCNIYHVVKNMTTSWTHGAKQNWTAWIIQTEFQKRSHRKEWRFSPWNFITDLENANVITNPFGLQATMWLQHLDCKVQQWSHHLLVETLLLPRLKSKKVLTTKIDFSTTTILKSPKNCTTKNDHKCAWLKMRKKCARQKNDRNPRTMRPLYQHLIFPQPAITASVFVSL